MRDKEEEMPVGLAVASQQIKQLEQRNCQEMVRRREEEVTALEQRIDWWQTEHGRNVVTIHFNPDLGQHHPDP